VRVLNVSGAVVATSTAEQGVGTSQAGSLARMSC